VRNPFLHKLILLFLVFGLSIHASGLDHILMHGHVQTHIDKKNTTIKKSDLTSLLDLNDREIELGQENEDELESSSFSVFYALCSGNICWEKSHSNSINSFKQRHSFKLPLFIHFENYRL